MIDEQQPPFGHPEFYAPISHMLRFAAEDPDTHAYCTELLYAADEIERLAGRVLFLEQRIEWLLEEQIKLARHEAARAAKPFEPPSQ